MRREQGALPLAQQLFRDVQGPVWSYPVFKGKDIGAVACQPARNQACGHRFLIDAGATAHINEVTALFHLGERLLTQKVIGALAKRQSSNKKVAAGEHFCSTDSRYLQGIAFRCRYGAHISGKDSAAKGCEHTGNGASHRTQAENAHR